MTSSGREALKWLALVLMTGDHINAAFFDRSLPYLSEMARLAFPVFAFVLAYNLTEPSAWAKRGQIILRLLVVAVIAQPFHAMAFGLGPLPLNVLFSFAAAIGVAHYVDRDQWFPAVALFLAAGFVVDYQWAGLAFFIGAWQWFGIGRWWTWGSLAAGFVALCAFNGNGWALVAFPVLLGFSALEVSLPRYRWLFYGYYPAHLAALALAVTFLPHQAA